VFYCGRGACIRRLFGHGDRSEFDSARACLHKALAKKPLDQNYAIGKCKAYGKRIGGPYCYKKLIAATSCPDSVRAEAYYYLACHSYMMANYTKAEQYCKGAYDIDKKDLYKTCMPDAPGSTTITHFRKACLKIPLPMKLRKVKIPAARGACGKECI